MIDTGFAMTGTATTAVIMMKTTHRVTPAANLWKDSSQDQQHGQFAFTVSSRMRPHCKAIAQGNQLYFSACRDPLCMTSVSTAHHHDQGSASVPLYEYR